jgi:hypothetical protein
MSGAVFVPTTTAAKLADAQTKYHALITGQLPSVFVDQSGESVRFTAADPAGLYAYVQMLSAQLVAENQGIGLSARRLRPLGFTFR